MASKTVLAVDLGAESGRVAAVSFDGKQMELSEISRFANIPVELAGTLHWNMLELWRQIDSAIQKSKDKSPISVGVDSWGVDFGLLDHNGDLLGLPVHYRDHRTQDIMEEVTSIIPKADIFAETGIQFMQINTLYQLRSLALVNSPALEHADTFLMIPDLIHYWMTGRKVCEFTNATTTQLYNTRAAGWARGLMEKLGIPSQIFPEVCQPGTFLGRHAGMNVIAPTSHDTGSAVVAVPARDKDFIYISSGTWSVVGCELPEPINSTEALDANFSNEGGVSGTVRLLKNITGLWILQECQRSWSDEGKHFTYPELIEAAEQAPVHQAFINLDAPMFLAPGDHPSLIRLYCDKTGQPPPETTGEFVRCILESLALTYATVIEKLEVITGKHFKTVHIIGGGSQNKLLCQLTSDATGREVVAGPVEASVIGNGAVQLMASGDIRDIAQAREIVARMQGIRHYEPEFELDWKAAAQQFVSLQALENPYAIEKN